MVWCTLWMGVYFGRKMYDLAIYRVFQSRQCGKQKIGLHCQWCQPCVTVDNNNNKRVSKGCIARLIVNVKTDLVKQIRETGMNKHAVNVTICQSDIAADIKFKTRKVRNIVSWGVCQWEPRNSLKSSRGQELLNICHLSESAGEQWAQHHHHLPSNTMTQHVPWASWKLH